MKTTTLGMAILGLVLAAGCSKAPQVESTARQEPAVEPVAESTGASFDCEGIQLLARFADDAVTLDLEEGQVELPRVESDSGSRYSDGETSFWTEGDEATLERASGTVTCVAQPIRSEDPEPGSEPGGEIAAEPEAAPAE